MKTLNRRIQRLEEQLGLIEPTSAVREAAQLAILMVAGIQRYGASMNRNLTAEEQRRIEEWEQPPEGRQRKLRPLDLQTVTEILEAGRQRALFGTLDQSR